MRVVRNSRYIGQQRRRAKLFALGGFLLFISVFGIMTLTQNLLFAYLAMLPAYVLFIVGMQQMGKWTSTSRRPRADLLLDQQLKNLPDAKYAMVHYGRLGKTSLEHVLLHPGGLLVVVVRQVQGKIAVKGTRFTRASNPLVRIMGASGPPLASPDVELLSATTALTERLAAEKLEVEVDGVVVFTSFDHFLEEDDPELDVISIAELPEYVRYLPADGGIRPQEQERIVALMVEGQQFERTEPVRTRRPVVVKRRAPASRPTTPQGR